MISMTQFFLFITCKDVKKSIHCIANAEDGITLFRFCCGNFGTSKFSDFILDTGKLCVSHKKLSAGFELPDIRMT
jgi:hypothetical protein